MSRCIGVIGLWLLLLGSEAGLAAGANDYQPRLEDYAFHGLLDEGRGTLQRVSLPGELLTVLTREDLGDVAVFDHNGTPMLTWVRPRKTATLRTSRALDFYPFTHGQIQYSGEETVRVTRDEGGRLETYDKRRLPATAEEVLSHYIIELPVGDDRPSAARGAPTADLYGIRLDWRHQPESRLLSVRMEVSADLNHWQLIRSRQSLTHRLERDSALQGQEILLEPERLKGQRYLRLSLNEPVTAFQIQVVEGLFRQPGPVIYHWLSGGPLIADKTDPAYLAFSIAPRVRPAGFRFRFDEPNQIIQGDLYSQPLKTDERILRQAGIVQHSVGYQEDSESNAPESGTMDPGSLIPLGGIQDTQWWFLPTRHLAVWPRVEIAMPDYELLFFASGEGPYRLAWGNRDAGPATGHGRLAASRDGLEKLIEAREAMGDIPEVALSGGIIAGDPARLLPETPVPLLRWLLWAVLLVTVVISGRMALYLYREMQRGG